MTQGRVTSGKAVVEADVALAVKDPTTGLTTDAAVTTNTTGTVSGKLRGLVAIFADVWDSTNHWLKTQLQAGEAHIGEIGLRRSNPQCTMVRPSDTIAYTTGDLIANSTTGGSVTSLSWSAVRSPALSGWVKRVRLLKTSTTTANALFRLHFLDGGITYTTGDNSPLAISGLGGAQYLGYVDIVADQVLDTKAVGTAYCNMNLKLGGTGLIAFLEARAAYVPTSAEIFSFVIEVIQD